ncbi:MAG: hypothetical protein ACOY46_06965 [Bacillota bacterium]
MRWYKNLTIGNNTGKSQIFREGTGVGFKDFESKVKDVKDRLDEEHREAVEQSITEINDTASDSK